MLSNLSNIPPCPFNKFEKSLIFWDLLKNENKMSPRKNETETINENIKLYSKNNIIKKVIEEDINVPDHVLLGLIFGTIKGPLKNFPLKKARVSFMKERNII